MTTLPGGVSNKDPNGLENEYASFFFETHAVGGGIAKKNRKPGKTSGIREWRFRGRFYLAAT
jgi:hypothetical protein